MAKQPEQSWPASKVDLWPIEKIVPYEKNPRTHSPEQISLIAASMKEDGVTAPILLDEAGVIIYGHGRRLAALQNGYTKYPVIIANGWSDDRKRAVRIKDNSLGLLSGWDPILISGELKTLKLAGFDIPLLGFPEAQLRGWSISSGTDGVVDPDAAPEPPKKPVVRKGDLWILGDHRLLCGDSTDAADVAIAMQNAKPNLMVTDPPYGVSYDPSWRNRAGVNVSQKKIGKVQNDDRADWSDAYHLFRGAIAYVWHAGLHASEVEESLKLEGFVIAAQIIWVKDRFALSRGDYHWQHEPCWYAVRKGAKHGWAGNRSQATTWPIPAREDDGHGHGTQKPIETMKRPIENSSRQGEHVYEPFSGSGTTIIACEMTGRKAIAIELDPAYVQVAVERWQNFTGRKSTLDGKTLEQVAKARRSGRPKAAADEASPGI